MAVNKDSERHQRPDWDDIVKMEADDTTLNAEEQSQLNNKSGFMSWEAAMRELDLPTDTKP